MKKTTKYLVTLIFCLSMIMATFIPAYAASVAQVKGLKATNVTYNSAVLTWTKASKVDGYELEKYNSSSKKWTVVKNDIKASTNKYSLTKLKMGTTYKYRVRAFTKSIIGRKTYGAYSSTVSVKPMPAKVTGFKASTITATTAKLTWTKVAGATGYKIQLYKDKKWTDYKKTTKNTLSITKLTYNTTYKYRIAAYRTENKKTYVGAYSSTLSVKTAVGKVTGLKISNITPTSAKATWKALTDVDGYKVVLTDPDGKKIVSKNTTKTTYSFSKLTPKVKYTLKITAYKKISKKTYTGKAVSKTITPKVAAATTLKTTVKPTSIAASWKKSADAQGYSVRLYDNGGKQLKSVTTTNLNYTFSGIAPGTYTVKVYAYVKISGTTYYSAALSSATLKATLPAPTALKTTVKPTSIAVSWTKAANATGYSVRLYDSNGKQLQAPITTGASYTFSGLTPNSSYTVKVYSYVTVSKTNYYSAALSSATLKTTIPAPTGLKVTKTTSNSVALSWSAAANASGYEVQYYTGGAWKSYTKTTALSATVSSLSANTTYKFRVRAYVSSYYSAFTSEVSATTLIASVSNLKMEAVSTASTIISWSAVSGASGYVVSCPGTATQDITDTSTLISYLDPNTEYTITVQAYKTTSGTKSYSDAKTIKVKTNIAFKNLYNADYFYMDEAFETDAKASFVLRWEGVNNAVYSVRSSAGESVANNITNNYVEITETGTETFSAKMEQQGTYKTRVSWDAQPGVSSYTVQIADATSKKWIDAGSYTGTYADFYLAPKTTYYARVIATTKASKSYFVTAVDKNDSSRTTPTKTILASQRPQLYAVTSAYTTPAATFTSSSNESKTLYTLWAVQALNNTKFQKGKLTVASKMDIDVSLSDTTIKIPGIIFPIPIGDFLKDNPELEAEIKDTLKTGESQTVTFNGGVGDMKSTSAQYIYDATGTVRRDANNKAITADVTKTVKTTPFDFIAPNSEYATFYNSQDVNKFGDKIENISVGTSGKNTTVTLTLKEESTDSKKGASGTPVHNGFVNGLTDQIEGLGDASLKIGKKDKNNKGTTVLTFVINNDVDNGILTNYKVNAPFNMTMTESDSGITINMVMDGVYAFDYKFS